jgi:16S rRNA (guanine527-N7)-methyltransferase
VLRYVEHLATTGVTHGLIGPREVPRLWERHVLNCAMLTEVLPMGTSVVDVGTGAGLPGIVLAIRRPDLEVILVEPLQRRVAWLQRVVADLGLDSITIKRSRAEELHGMQVPVVTARAVAPLSRLVAWGLPLLLPGGCLLAVKGRAAQAELDETRAGLADGIVADSQILRLGGGLVEEPTTVVRLVRGQSPLSVDPPAGRSAGGSRPRRRR